MAYPTILNNQYKAEKANGTTTATSFPIWHKELLAKQERLLPLVLDTNKPSIKDIIAVAQQALEVVEQTTTKTKSKAAIALDVYEALALEAALTDQPLVRKTIIQAFINQAGLTMAGASTYLQNIKAKKGLVNHA